MVVTSVAIIVDFNASKNREEFSFQTDGTWKAYLQHELQSNEYALLREGNFAIDNKGKNSWLIRQ